MCVLTYTHMCTHVLIETNVPFIGRHPTPFLTFSDTPSSILHREVSVRQEPQVKGHGSSKVSTDRTEISSSVSSDLLVTDLSRTSPRLSCPGSRSLTE